MVKQFLEALEKGKEYDFIANNYHLMKNYELKDILLEYIYASQNQNLDLSELKEELYNQIDDEYYGKLSDDLDMADVKTLKSIPYNEPKVTKMSK